ncbi:MAG: twin-arginine translocation pathway signal protein, partial [Burkholderiaceae bacterium]|nr:twin-arginine translocation pathway signal protein [Burkholderiaceae bacterium]
MPETIMTNRRCVLFSLALLASTRQALAEPAMDAMRFVVGYPAGGTLDLIARKLAEKLAPHHARQVLVDNKPGAAGRLAVDEVRRATPDGSVVLLTPASVVTMYPHVYRQLAYDPFADL